MLRRTFLAAVSSIIAATVAGVRGVPVIRGQVTSMIPMTYLGSEMIDGVTWHRWQVADHPIASLGSVRVGHPDDSV